MSRATLRVFEHQTLRVGESGGTLDGARVTFTAAHLEALARFNDFHAQRYFQIGYRCVTFQSYVGYVEVGKLGIEILPKADRKAGRGENQESWQRLLLEMLRVATGLRLYSPSTGMQR